MDEVVLVLREVLGELKLIRGHLERANQLTASSVGQFGPMVENLINMIPPEARAIFQSKLRQAGIKTGG